MKRNGLKGRSARKGAFRRKVMRIWRCDILDYTLDCGPVAQLGARFHGMEEVDGSNPSRSTSPSLRYTRNRTNSYRIGVSQSPMMRDTTAESATDAPANGRLDNGLRWLLATASGVAV